MQFGSIDALETDLRPSDAQGIAVNHADAPLHPPFRRLQEDRSRKGKREGKEKRSQSGRPRSSPRPEERSKGRMRHRRSD
jgi:hypothetical protein